MMIITIMKCVTVCRALCLILFLVDGIVEKRKLEKLVPPFESFALSNKNVAPDLLVSMDVGQLDK